jgi:holin-like protein
MLKALFYIFLFLAMGELVINLIDIPISGNILGMMLIFIALKLKLIKLETVKPASDKLVKYMVLFFVPYGVGLMAYFDFISPLDGSHSCCGIKHLNYIVCNSYYSTKTGEG